MIDIEEISGYITEENVDHVCDVLCIVDWSEDSFGVLSRESFNNVVFDLPYILIRSFE